MGLSPIQLIQQMCITAQHCSGYCPYTFFVCKTWCPPRDSNSYTSRRRNLNPVRLPIPPKGQKLLLNICMSTANVNLGIDELLRYASTDTYQEDSSWTTEKEFKPTTYNMVLPPRIEQGSTVLQTVAMTTSAKGA